jgi:hypothetical protein
MDHNSLSGTKDERKDEQPEQYAELMDKLEALVYQKFGAETVVETEVGDDVAGWGLLGSGKRPGKRAGRDKPFRWRE